MTLIEVVVSMDNDDIYWGNVPVTHYWNGATQYLIHDILWDIKCVLFFDPPYLFHGAKLT